MKIIKTINDIIEINSDYPFHFMEHLKEEFMLLYEALGDEENLFDFTLPEDLAFCVFQEGDGVKSVCIRQFDLEFAEKFHVEQVTFYRIGIRSNDEVTIYYSLKGMAPDEDENWLEEQAEFR
ncbi:hypothetical protein M3610_13515 [Neobacillus sp. MER 74]|uniref:hypothetical protein n=1 Tax=Neobacillus sp. MER 74 TaxID=2939566 RepID=UPI0020411C0C|nr:hypothetical protein [Neobacillus sp. MER 74]MCM3116318.1 hypothetical protein [Neobacillus sp. MER 74]